MWLLTTIKIKHDEKKSGKQCCIINYNAGNGIVSFVM
jgi:hypothetical protein